MRLFSLDVFRGITIAAMILVNMAGVADQVYTPLAHADWHGCTPTDLVFPFFLFIVGVSMSFSLPRYTEKVYPRILWRVAILFTLGLILNGFWNRGIWTFDLSNIRIMGVLQRISLTYLFAAIAVLKLPPKGHWILAGVLLIGSWLTMMYVPVPNYGAGVLTPTGNFGAYVDRLIIPPVHLYAGDGYKNLADPEGLFSSITAVVNVMAGYFTGKWIREQPVTTRTTMGLGLFGIGCLIIGWVWGLTFPINKKLWTSSYVMFSTGWALLFLAACYELIEVRLIRRWSKPFEIMGLNAIALFTASVLLIKILVRTKIGTGETAITIYNWIYQNIFASWAGELNGSFLFALVTLLFWLAVSYLMYRQQWFIKV
jgi:predicted acyltransferase